MGEDYALEQYKLTWDAFNREMQRFWFRFNILIGLELAAFLGVVAKYDVLEKMPNVLCIGLFMLTAFSTLTCFIVWRAIQVYELLATVIRSMEDSASTARPLFILKWAEQVAETQGMANVEKPYAMWYGLVIAVVLAISWCLWWFWVFDKLVNSP